MVHPAAHFKVIHNFSVILTPPLETPFDDDNKRMNKGFWLLLDQRHWLRK
jgi:hypothetical protein